MPSVGRIRQFSVAAASSRIAWRHGKLRFAANDVWLWACHDPNGNPLTDLGSQVVEDNADGAARSRILRSTRSRTAAYVSSRGARCIVVVAL
jgi:hypothetical protein